MLIDGYKVDEAISLFNSFCAFKQEHKEKNTLDSFQDSFPFEKKVDAKLRSYFLNNLAIGLSWSSIQTYRSSINPDDLNDELIMEISIKLIETIKTFKAAIWNLEINEKENPFENKNNEAPFNWHNMEDFNSLSFLDKIIKDDSGKMKLTEEGVNAYRLAYNKYLLSCKVDFSENISKDIIMHINNLKVPVLKYVDSAKIMSNLGEFYYKINDYNKCFYYLSVSNYTLSFYKDLNLSDLIYKNLVMLATCTYHMSKSTKQAEEIFERMLKSITSLPPSANIAFCYKEFYDFIELTDPKNQSKKILKENYSAINKIIDDQNEEGFSYRKSVLLF